MVFKLFVNMVLVVLVDIVVVVDIIDVKYKFGDFVNVIGIV